MDAFRLSLVAAAVATLGACGGGGGGGGDSPPEPTTTSVSVTVGAGVPNGTVVCQDVNANGSCDSGEPTGTASAGVATLQVPVGDEARYPVLAVVDGVAYTAAPGSSLPLGAFGMLVVEQLRVTGTTQEEAATSLQQFAGLAVSPLANHAAGTDLSSRTAALAERVLGAALRRQLDTLLPLAGQSDGDVPMTAATIRSVVTNRMPQLLSGAVDAAAAALADGTCADAAAAACGQRVAEQGAGLAAAHPLQPATLPQYAKAQRLLATAVAATGPGTPQQAGFSLDTVNPGDAGNYFYRVLMTSSAGSVPDADGRVTATDERVRSSNGTITRTSWTNDPGRQGDLHWSGSAWVGCVVGDPIKSTQRDAGGLNRSNSCDSLNVNAIRQVAQDVSGQPMRAVVDWMAVPRPGFGVPLGGFEAAAGALDGATFPQGSLLLHRWTTDLSLAITYDVRSSNLVNVYPADVTAGGDARGATAPPCAVPANQVQSPADSLDTLVARYRGTPCAFNQGSQTVGGQVFSSLAPNEWTGQSTLSIGVAGTDVVGAAPQTGYYTGNRLLRVAFGDAGRANYLSCLQRWTDGSPRNCTPIGTGRYEITQLGDGRVLTLLDVPGQAAVLSYERVFVERGGAVYYGFRSKTAALAYNPRLNATAGNALLAQWSIPAVQVP